MIVLYYYNQTINMRNYPKRREYVIKLYTAGTPNGRKISIFPEEAGLAYETHVIDIHKGDPFDPAFQLINPDKQCRREH